MRYLVGLAFVFALGMMPLSSCGPENGGTGGMAGDGGRGGEAIGILDPDFGLDGIVVHDNAAGGSTWDMGLALTIDAAGKIVVAGMSMNASGIFDMVLWRYNADGTLDPTWDGDGIVVHDNAAGGRYFDVGEALTIDAAGKIVVAGYSGNASGNDDMVLWRYK